MEMQMASETDARYSHEPLGSDLSIRLIRLYPSKGLGDRLELDLFEISLESAPEQHYEALSYTWGAPGHEESVTCCGRMFSVRANCAAALRRLRYTDKDRILWVDTICIDQSDTPAAIRERTIQIIMMGEVYSKAKQTICWLGEGTVYTNAVMKHIESIGKCPSRRGCNKLLRLEGLASLQSKGHITPGSTCLDHIFCHDWHCRVWTVQEVALSSSCYILCGTSTIAWIHYAAAADFLLLNPINKLDVRAKEAMRGISLRTVLRGYTARMLESPPIIDNGTEHRRIFDLVSCLNYVVSLDATDSRDKIYGLMALYANFGVAFPPIDYQQSIAELYTAATRNFIAWSGSLTFLVHACSINRDSTFPSWVPDWRDTSTRLFMPSSDATRGSRWAPPQMSTTHHSRDRLRVRGKIIGKVEFVVERFPTHVHAHDPGILSGDAPVLGVESVNLLRLLIKRLEFFSNMIFEVVRYGGHYSKAQDQLVAALLSGSKLTDASDREAFEAFWDLLFLPSFEAVCPEGLDLARRWRRDDIQNAMHWGWGQRFEYATLAAGLLSSSLLLRSGKPLQCKSVILDLIEKFSTHLADQAIFKFEMDAWDRDYGPALGSAFSTAVAGDSIVLLQGAQWPVLLRKAINDAQTWQFISPAYVPRNMEGRLWPAADKDLDEALQVFELA